MFYYYSFSSFNTKFFCPPAFIFTTPLFLVWFCFWGALLWGVCPQGPILFSPPPFWLFPPRGSSWEFPFFERAPLITARLSELPRVFLCEPLRSYCLCLGPWVWLCRRVVLLFRGGLSYFPANSGGGPNPVVLVVVWVLWFQRADFSSTFILTGTRKRIKSCHISPAYQGKYIARF